MEFVSFFLLGSLISVLSGFFGIGGGFILTPTLLLMGFSPIDAITTSLFYTIGTSISGMVVHYKMKNIYWKGGLWLGVSGVVATQIARPVVFFINDQGWDDVVIPSLYVAMLAYFIYKMLVRTKRTTEGGGQEKSNDNVALKLIIIGFIAGFASTTLGVGGGFIIVPLVISFLSVNPKKAVGTSLFAVFLIVNAGFISYALTVTINYQIGLVLIIGGLIGSQFGANLMSYFKSVEIERLLAMLYVATLVSVVAKLFQLSLIGLIVLFAFLGYFVTQSIVKVRKMCKQSHQSEA